MLKFAEVNFTEPGFLFFDGGADLFADEPGLLFLARGGDAFDDDSGNRVGWVLPGRLGGLEDI